MSGNTVGLEFERDGGDDDDDDDDEVTISIAQNFGARTMASSTGALLRPLACACVGCYCRIIYS